MPGGQTFPSAFRPRPGHGALSVQSVDGHSAATAVRSASPLKLLVPRPRGPSVWAYTSSFGGGIVAGDQTRLDLVIDPGSRCYLGTQASTKVYRDPHRRDCGHETRARVGEGALLVFAPDPVQAFADSAYQQRQEFHLAADASLVLLDWFTAGRSARGERWAFRSLRSRSAVFRPGPNGTSRPVFLDGLRLSGDEGPTAGAHRTGRHLCFATLLLSGPLVADMSRAVLDDVGRRPVARQAAMLWAASPVGDGVVLRLAGEEVEAVGREVHRWLAPVAAVLGDDPWARKW